MFALNLKKDWQMNKSLFVIFITIGILLFLVNTGFYLVIKYVSDDNILKVIWLSISGLSSLAGKILTIILMFFILSRDLGKNNVHSSIFTPQSLLSWFLPKVLYIFFVQAIFAGIDFGYTLFIQNLDMGAAANNMNDITTWELVLSELTSIFSFGLFALLTLCMALYYSFRKKLVPWILIVVASLVYFLGLLSFTVYSAIQTQVNHIHYSNETRILVPYIIVNVIGLIYIFISLHLFDKKIEY